MCSAVVTRAVWFARDTGTALRSLDTEAQIYAHERTDAAGRNRPQSWPSSLSKPADFLFNGCMCYFSINSLKYDLLHRYILAYCRHFTVRLGLAPFADVTNSLYQFSCWQLMDLAGCSRMPTSRTDENKVTHSSRRTQKQVEAHTQTNTQRCYLAIQSHDFTVATWESSLSMHRVLELSPLARKVSLSTRAALLN